MKRSVVMWTAAVIVVGMASLVPLLADDDGNEKNDLGPKLWQAALIRVASLPSDPLSIIPANWGTDPLADGSIEVRGKGWVKAELRAAAANAEYSLYACKLSTAADRCALIGKVTTDGDGDARAELEWPSGATGPHSVFFLLRRNDLSMFVSGFILPAGLPPVPGTPPAAEIEVKGVIASVGTNSFLIEGVTQTILVDDNTKFLGPARSLSDLKPGMTVEVDGTATSGGILASRVQTRPAKSK